MNAVLDRRGAKWASGLLALLVHALFFLVLVFGLSWRVEKPAPPVQAQLWMSLPPVVGSVLMPPHAVPVMPSPPPRAARPAPRRSATPAHSPAPAQHASVPSMAAAPTLRAPSVPGAAIRLRAAPRQMPHRAEMPAPAAPPRLPDLATLGSQVETAAAEVTRQSVFQQIHNPDSLTARYYLAALLQRIQHVGDVIYTGKGVGSVAVYLIVGADGSVQALQIDGVSGDPTLPDFAREIIDRSAPFPPFPEKLARESSRIKLEVRMQFLGTHQVNF